MAVLYKVWAGLGEAKGGYVCMMCFFMADEWILDGWRGSFFALERTCTEKIEEGGKESGGRRVPADILANGEGAISDYEWIHTRTADFIGRYRQQQHY